MGGVAGHRGPDAEFLAVLDLHVERAVPVPSGGDAQPHAVLLPGETLQLRPSGRGADRQVVLFGELDEVTQRGATILIAGHDRVLPVGPGVCRGRTDE
ncbi:hypothetical protein HR12_20840 [Microbacterium sp. SUBG005]|nr:hypothetical protein HR12_20840 [Microbacterium sp. SUBG005]